MRLPLWLATLMFFAFGAASCDPAKMPEDQPGPPGCGLKDPRETAPGMLSLAQKMTLKKKGKPGDVAKNAEGGLDWVYKSTAGSVFGQEETVTVYTFDKQGLLKGVDKELVSKVGK